MIDLTQEVDLHDINGFPSSNSILNRSIDAFDPDYQMQSETMRLLFITIILISVLACLSIFISIFICVCLNRRQTKNKGQEQKDRLLVPDQADNRISRLPPNNPIAPARQTSSSTSTGVRDDPSRTSFYDQYEDIPFIDESRPTSYIEIAKV